MLEILFAIMLGCLLGVFTGLIPGIHVNTVALVLLLFFSEGNEFFIVLIVAMSVTHTFVDFIPSIFLGAPDDESFLSVLPGHKMLLRGEALTAINLTILGGLFAGICTLALAPFFMIFCKKIFETLPMFIPGILILVLFLMLLSEKRRFPAILVIFLSSVLGIIVLRNAAISNPLFPLVTGFFGASTVLASIRKNPQIPKQKKPSFLLEKINAVEGTLYSFIGGSFVSLLPSLGASQAAFIMGKLSGKMDDKQYLLMLGGINTVNMVMSFFVMYAIGKTRTGSAAIIKNLTHLENEHLILIASASLIAMFFGAMATKKISSFLSNKMCSVPYKKINYSVLIILTVLAIVLSGAKGLVVLITATAIGFYTIQSGIKRTNCMSFLMIPTILIYLGL